MTKYLVDMLITWRPPEREIEADSLEEAIEFFKFDLNFREEDAEFFEMDCREITDEEASS